MPSQMSSGPHRKVVIVGAGLSGLSAATHLSARGIDTVVLEAQDRSGGRVHTARLPSPTPGDTTEGRLVDLGATWFHGTTGNAAFDLALSMDLVPPPVSTPAPPSGSALVDSCAPDTADIFGARAVYMHDDGPPAYVEPECTLPTARAYVAALALVTSGNATIPEGDDRLQTLLHDLLQTERLAPVARSVVRTCDLFECAYNGCASTADLSAALSPHYLELPGDNVPLAGGMSAVVRALESKLGPSAVVRYEAAVRVVTYTAGACGVRLESGESIEAHMVIWTPSLNVTKHACSTNAFNPPLPERKRRALAQRGQSAVEKVFAVLQEPLVDVEAHTTTPLLWAGVARDGREDAWERDVFGVVYDDALQSVSFWLSGASAVQFCALPLAAARAQVQTLVRAVYLQHAVVQTIMRSNWNGNPFVRGAYSFPLAGGERDAVQCLGEPLPCRETPVLCFAGEATHARFYSTMHGAIESGIREAERCATYLESMKDETLATM